MAVLKIAPFWRSTKSRTPAAVVPLDDSLGLDAFGSESSAMVAPASTALAAPRKARAGFPIFDKTWRMAALIVLLAAAFATLAYQLRNRPLPWAARTGSITFDTVPSGLDVFVGQNSIGRSPVTVALPPGTYDVRLGSGPQARPLKVAVTAGASVVQHYEMAPSPAAAPTTTGALRIQTEPGNLPVLIDGVEKGVSPVTIDSVDAGDHEVTVRLPQSTIKRAVRVVAGERTSVIISSTPPKPDASIVTAGWLSATAPFPLTVKEGGRLVGTTDVDKLMLPSGDHDLEFVNDALGFRATRHVTITAGKTTVSSMTVPNGSLSLNAVPWADVFVDGKHIGQTPLGNLSLPIGAHEVTFRHPDLGERKESITVTTTAPARLGVDLRKK